jgi:translation initiation factor IF-2
MSWFPAPFKFLDLLKSAESFVSEQRKNEALKLEEARVAAELKAKQEADERARVEAELKAKLEAEAKLAAEVAAKEAAKAALLAAKKVQDSVKKLYIGKSCPKLKSKKTVSGVKLVCVKKGKKLVWAEQ